jgi:hypothetical protein
VDCAEIDRKFELKELDLSKEAAKNSELQEEI